MDAHSHASTQEQQPHNGFDADKGFPIITDKGPNYDWQSRLFVHNIDESVRRSHIELAFQKHGEILAVVTKGRYAIVQFSCPEAMQSALAAEQGRLQFNGQLTRITI